MKALKLLSLGWLFCIQPFISSAQSDTAIAIQRAMLFGDSLIKASFYQDWTTFINLSTHHAIKYYGGKDGFKEHVIMLYFHYEPTLEEKPETISIGTILNDADQWQCIVEKVRSTLIDSRRARIYTYLVGQSKDNGETWKFVDVSHNSVKNVIYIMPDIFSTLAIPDRKIVYEDEELAAAQVAETPKKVAPKKKPAGKKKK